MIKNYPKFIVLVKRMWQAQKLYFKTRTQSALKSAKELEDSVDRVLEEVGFQGMKIQQLRLDAGGPHKTDEVPGAYNATKQDPA